MHQDLRRRNARTNPTRWYGGEVRWQALCRGFKTGWHMQPGAMPRRLRLGPLGRLVSLLSHVRWRHHVPQPEPNPDGNVRRDAMPRGQLAHGDVWHAELPCFLRMGRLGFVVHLLEDLRAGLQAAQARHQAGGCLRRNHVQHGQIQHRTGLDVRIAAMSISLRPQRMERMVTVFSDMRRWHKDANARHRNPSRTWWRAVQQPEIRENGVWHGDV
mmetsp:Transcript_102337/g.289100  ORF Transcript_102337/g.289100 Transcript_102337/m.289100 type:complete len:214 (+) Transcript_102337:105-746(+)